MITITMRKLLAAALAFGSLVALCAPGAAASPDGEACPTPGRCALYVAFKRPPSAAVPGR